MSHVDPNAHHDLEWENVRRLAKRLFGLSRDQGDLTAMDIEAWRVTWPDASPADVALALQGLARSGVEWMPRAGGLAPFMPKPTQMDAADFSTVLSVVDGARYLPKSQAVARVSERCGELAAAWMCAEGIDALKSTELAHPEFGPSVKRDLERRYKAFVSDQTDRVRRGLPAARATAAGELAGGRRDLKRLDFGSGLRALEPGEVA